ncbi:MAG TPA: helix-turn-helix transcriptional regulator [Thermoanaerobaculia bacterium]|nr:helix-turn-helix transcriptional regulator [Thermoanaerobaculia bacterium]
MATKKKKRPSKFAVELGRRLEEKMRSRGLNQKQLADRIKAQPAQISRYLKGEVVPEAETLATIAETLEVSLDELVLGRPSAVPEDGVRDVRLRERVRELEKVDQRFREAAITVIDAFVVQGNHEATAARLQGNAKT